MPLVPEFHWCQSLVPVGFNIAHVLFVCRQLTPETGTGYWYQKTGQCVRPLRMFISGTRPFCVTNSRQWSSVVLLLSIASTNFICISTSNHSSIQTENILTVTLVKRYMIILEQKTYTMKHLQHAMTAKQFSQL